jgi:WD40 repeat protein/transcriptional regulator with XRE-family HTH domain
MAEAGEANRAQERFSGLLLRHRGRTGLTQRQLAERVGVNRRALQDWEAGVNCPGAGTLQTLLVALLESDGLIAGQEADEAKALWSTVLRQAPRMHTQFDPGWFDGLLAARSATATTHALARLVAAEHAAVPHPGLASEVRQSWDDAPDVRDFVGRADELMAARDLVLQVQCRLVGVMGMGGIGKTSFAAKLAQEVAPAFNRVCWRSLRNALPVAEWLAEAIGVLSGQQVTPPHDVANQLEMLLQLLRERRNLLVLDNFETVLEAGQHEGRYRDGFDGYGAVLNAIGDSGHQSCLIVTSREAPPELALLDSVAVRSVELRGLGVSDGQVLLAHKQLRGGDAAWARLIARYGGNGLALKVVGESIRQVFDGDISSFLEEAGASAVFGGIRRLLAEQLDRSSPLEQHVLRLLAVQREPVSIAEMLAIVRSNAGRGVVLEAIEALRRRSLLERSVTARPTAFTLQSVVLEQVTDRLVEEVADEIAGAQPDQLLEQPLIQAQAKDYVRQTQERLIGEPVLQRLKTDYGVVRTEQLLLALLDGWRGRPPAAQGYGPGNVVNLLRLGRGELRGLNLAHLAIRQPHLAGVEAQDTSLAGAHLSEATLADAFNFPLCVALSADGGALAAGTSTGEVRLWRLSDRAALLSVAGHIGPVHAVALTSDGRLLASGGFDGTIRLSETPSGRPLTKMEAGGGGVRGVALSADGRLVANGGEDGRVQVWEAPTGRPVWTVPGHIGPVGGVSLTRDGRLLASCGVDGLIRLWHVPGGQPLATLEGHVNGVLGVALSTDGRLLASSGLDQTIRLWAVPSGRPLATLKGHSGPVWGVALSPDGRLLTSGGLDGTVRLWDTASGQGLAVLTGHVGGTRGIALTGDAQLVASSGFDGTIRLWEAPNGRALATLQGHAGPVWSVAVAPDRRLLASGGEDGKVRLWDAISGQSLASMDAHTGPTSVALSADGRRLASGGFEGTICLWELPNGRLLRTLRGHAGGLRSVALSGNGRLLAGGGFDGTIQLWDAATGELQLTLHGHTSPIWGVALSEDGRLLAAGIDRTARLWEVPGGRLLATLEGHTGEVWGVALSADGRLLASSGFDGAVRLWEVPAGRLLATLCGHTSTVWRVALSGDGRLLASGGQDGTVCLWEVSERRLLARLAGSTGKAASVALSADGRLVVSGSFDGTVQLWDATRGEHLRTLRPDRRYERMDITGVTGITPGQRAVLRALGAVEMP